MIKIGIVARKSIDEEGKPCFLLREPNLRNAVLKAGGIPILLLPQQLRTYENLQKPPFTVTEEEKEKTIELLELCDGFILPGGDEWTYLDDLVITYAKETKKPILGICLGMQVMAIDNDFSKLKKLPDKAHKTIDNYVHSIKIKENSLLHKIIKKEELKVNSRHIHTVENNLIYEVIAVSDDNVIEAIEYKDHPFFLGVQWHPEDMQSYDEYSRIMFDKFLKSCQKK